MLSWCEPQTALPFTYDVGLNPPVNQPHGMPLAFSRSPILDPAISRVVGLTAPLASQSSCAGGRFPIRVPLATAEVARDEIAPCVCPLIRFSACCTEGPKVPAKLLSLIAKRWAEFQSPVTVLPS